MFQFFNDVLLERETESVLSSHVYALLYEVVKIAPELLIDVLPKLKSLLQVRLNNTTLYVSDSQWRIKLSQSQSVNFRETVNAVVIKWTKKGLCLFIFFSFSVLQSTKDFCI